MRFSWKHTVIKQIYIMYILIILTIFIWFLIKWLVLLMLIIKMKLFYVLLFVLCCVYQFQLQSMPQLLNDFSSADAYACVANTSLTCDSLWLADLAWCQHLRPRPYAEYNAVASAVRSFSNCGMDCNALIFNLFLDDHQAVTPLILIWYGCRWNLCLD